MGEGIGFIADLETAGGGGERIVRVEYSWATVGNWGGTESKMSRADFAK